MTAESENRPTENTKHQGPPIKTLQLGVYRVVTEVFPPLNLREQWNNGSTAFPTWLRLIQVACTSGPWLFYLFISADVWYTSIEPTPSLHLSSRVLAIIEIGLKNHKPDGPAIFQAVALRMPRYTSRAQLATDLTSVQGSKHISERRAWLTFSSSIDVACNAGAMGQITYISRTVLSTGQGTIFGLLCLVHPILEAVFERILYNHPHIVEENDQHFLWVKGPRVFSDSKYKQDIITGTGDILYYAANAIFSPRRLSLATSATLHQSESLLSWMFDMLLYRVRVMTGIGPETLSTSRGRRLALSASWPSIRARNALRAEARTLKGYTRLAAHPIPETSPSTPAPRPMRWTMSLAESRRGSPSSSSARTAARRRRGHQAYRLADLRHATAALTQDRHLYLLSLRENIGLGNPAHVRDMDMIRAVARWSGAEEVIAKMGEGFETVLEHPRGLQYASTWGTRRLWRRRSRMAKEADVSDRGRGAATISSIPNLHALHFWCRQARVRRRAQLEPPEAEWQLFQNLRQARDGKTMLFVTHRFAHLTKHADVILCTKDGRILGTGTHTELMTFEGGVLQDVQDSGNGV
ncbi:hypothetical protein DFH08DRAFT_944013 [Mycena albidolilacea]|uniref:P-loop containing nucleoside triphosphate hydrolase protein n=1 Tax=Mycena albidolilacea TaxID=1033008 RepID=A0AAD6Z7E1_9AGAR|nr:hypothetical protein DFH08DRAFT_944013 [Mycena albidolilacea]